MKGKNPTLRFLMQSTVTHWKKKWSYFLTKPILTFQARKNQIIIQNRRFENKNPLSKFKKIFNKKSAGHRFDPQGPPFQGGAVGYLSYEALHYFPDGKTVPLPKRDDVRAPWMHFLFFDAGVAVNEQNGKIFLFGPQKKAEKILAEFQAIQKTFGRQGKTGKIKSNFSKSQYVAAVEKIRGKIKAGETYQANLSQRFSAQTKKNPWRVFESLNQANPSPYAAYFETPELTVVSNSPELLFEIRGRHIVTKPIKGTRPRGRTPAEDKKLENQLVHSEKDLAELSMIVDLERNDLGKICQPGSIRVQQPFAVEKYSHVQHLVGTVKGTLRRECTAFDALEALFPGGSITGCPKVRTLQILREIESVARGPYTGSLGWIGWNGDAAFNILIRTAYFKRKNKGRKQNQIQNVYFHAGGGIVYDSQPQAEYLESLDKAKAIRKILEIKE